MKISRNNSLKTAIFLVGVEYGLVFFGGIVWPIGYQIIEQPGNDMPVHLTLIPITILLFCMAWIGHYFMRRSLKIVGDARLTNFWSLVATGLAPFSLIFYFFIWQIATFFRWFLSFH